MSLALVFCTCHGIIMSADRCITTTLSSGASFCATMSERKLFLSNNNFGISYTGVASFEGLPASYWVQKFMSRFDKLHLSLKDYVLKLCKAFKKLSPNANVIINGCGYQDDKPCVYSCSSKNLSFADFLAERKTAIVVSGENDLALAIIDALPIDHQKYTVTDAIEFVKHVNLTVSNIQRFAQAPITVSPQCDVLLLTSNDAKWIVQPPSMF